MKYVYLIFTLLLSFSSVSIAGTLNGNVKILEKGGESPIASFDNAIVYLTGDLPLNSKTKFAESRQERKEFEPRLLPALAGQPIHFVNYDHVFHNVFSTEVDNAFDLGRYPKGAFKAYTYDKPGIYKVYCNIHKSMVLDIVVLDNEFYAITDKKGDFTIEDVPSGEYQLNVWHIHGGQLSKSITVTTSDIVIPEITIESTKVVRSTRSRRLKRSDNIRDRRYQD